MQFEDLKKNSFESSLRNSSAIYERVHIVRWNIKLNFQILKCIRHNGTYDA